MYRRDVIITFLIVLLVTVGLQSWGAAKRDDLYAEFQTLATVVQKIKQNYVEEVSEKKIFEGALRGAVMNLDRYSAYISPEDYEDFKTKTTGEFQGLGIELGVRQGWLTVIAPIEETPAARAGILAGDRIVKIEGQSTENMSIQDAVKHLRGQKGSKVNITVEHQGEREAVDISVVRDVIPLVSVRGYRRTDVNGKWDYFVDAKDKIGYIRVSAFQENTMEDFDKAIAQLRADGMKALVLDLRFNPGGPLLSAVDMCNRFLDTGVIVSTRARVGDPTVYSATKTSTLPQFPVAVLINNWSASASEIVAGALQDHKRAVLVGEHSFGKGSVQTVIPLEDGNSALKLTTAHYYTPSGHGINRDEDTGVGGLTPDIVVDTSLQDEIALQRHWQQLATPKLKSETVVPKEQPKEQPKETQPQEAAPEEGVPKPEKQPKPFVDEQLQRAVDALKVLQLFEPRVVGKEAA